MFSSKTVVIVTGASRGLGRAIACSLAREFSHSDHGKKSVFILVARSKDGLEETKSAVGNICGVIKVNIVPGDLGDLKNLPQLVSSFLDPVDAGQFSSALLVNNAGSTGDVKKWLTDHSDVKEVQSYMDFNVTSPVYLISQFVKKFPNAKRYVVNVSSLTAVKPIPSMSLYCTGKAARDMLHSVLAEESKDVRVLNYAPGPMKTAMTDDVRENSCNVESRKYFKEITETVQRKPNVLKSFYKDLIHRICLAEFKISAEVEKNLGPVVNPAETIQASYSQDNEGKILNPETSSEKLVVVLKQDRYQSGQHLDYFDALP